MIGVEIKKNGQLYQFKISHTTDLDRAYERAVAIAQNKDNWNDGENIVDLGTSSEYEHIRVWKEDQGVKVDPPPAAAEEPKGKNYVKAFEDRITWLGMDLKLKGVKAVEDGVPMVLVYEINDEPAQVQIAKENLAQLAQYQGQVLGYTSPLALVPGGDLLDEEAALEYVQDYIHEVRTAKINDNVDKTAAAFFGFTKDE